MKPILTKKTISSAGLAALAVMVGLAGSGPNANSQTSDMPAPITSATLDTSVVTVAPAVLPATILPDSPLAQVVRLVQAGVSENIILAYVKNTGDAFNLDSNVIIYLSNLGAPDELVTAMMQHDQQLQSQMAASTTPTAAPPPATTDTENGAIPATPPDQQPVSVNYFYTSLAPYGAWVDLPGYGRCWRPTAVIYNADWQPYCDNGHWVYTDCGWYWASDYAWGMTFHYGRWFRDSRIGWCWWPDSTWGPSWVSWRSATDYCGWAPLPPFTVCRQGGYYYRGAAVGVSFNFGLSANLFTFVPTRNFNDRHLRNYRADRMQTARFYNDTRVINNISVNNHSVFNHGISPANIANVTHTPVRQISVRDLGNPGVRRYNNDPAAYRSGSTGHASTTVQSGAPGQNHYSSQAQQSQRNNGSTTVPQRPPTGNNYHAGPSSSVIQPPARVIAPQTISPRLQSPPSPLQSQRFETPRNNTGVPQGQSYNNNQNQPRSVAPPANYQSAAPSQPDRRNFNQPRNSVPAEQPGANHPSAQRPPDSQPHQNYSAPAPSQHANGQNQNPNQNPNGPSNGRNH